VEKKAILFNSFYLLLVVGRGTTSKGPMVVAIQKKAVEGSAMGNSVFRR
jgi:hypothetical protein